MRRLLLISCLLVTAVTPQTAQRAERPLPQWLTGIIALCIFLFLTFVTLLVKRAWCEDTNRKTAASEVVYRDGSISDTTLEMARREEKLATDDHVEKVTSM